MYLVIAAILPRCLVHVVLSLSWRSPRKAQDAAVWDKEGTVRWRIVRLLLIEELTTSAPTRVIDVAVLDPAVRC
jgi:hypothetical protein